MRNLLLAVAVLSIYLFACKKETVPTKPTNPVTSEEKFPVTLSVGQFLHTISPMARKADPSSTARDSVLAGKVSYLYFFLYTELGEYVKTIVQNADSTIDFGNYTDTLPANRYMIAAVAATGRLDIQDLGNYYNNRVRFPDANLPGRNVSAPDIFAGNAYFVVTGYGSSQFFNIWLNRVVGRVELNITDAPDYAGPGDTSVLVYTSPSFRTYAYISGYLDELMPEPGIILQRNSRTNFSTHLLNYNSEITVTIEYPDQVTGARKKREMRYVPFMRGYRTLMSGSIYNPAQPATSFSVSLDTTWNTWAEVPF